jgi:2-keto-4-pentenoate hydratase/2-oxohepta-3-ene-1,7-dioic acid hydratase in catechol pathway
MELCLSVNGEVRQLASTELMVHSFESIMGHLEGWYGLSPGDLIWTGTPKGVGAMKEGDLIEAWMKNSDGAKVSSLIGKCVI